MSDVKWTEKYSENSANQGQVILPPELRKSAFFISQSGSSNFSLYMIMNERVSLLPTVDEFKLQIPFQLTLASVPSTQYPAMMTPFRRSAHHSSNNSRDKPLWNDQIVTIIIQTGGKAGRLKILRILKIQRAVCIIKKHTKKRVTVAVFKRWAN